MSQEDSTRNVETANANSARSWNQDLPRSLPIQETENPQTSTKCVENAFELRILEHVDSRQSKRNMIADWCNILYMYVNTNSMS
ncbi:hypothetical protein DPMN_061949 [Dreissena polymorpha]|uniref:Uncharacterized protein n=2 Tax=Dreissena polymorpha TaxID=45954 RepID=A0A9D4HIX0_DREPO|nr:hypothetical protein DPMN_061949 [Dreissena polymorpha]